METKKVLHSIDFTFISQAEGTKLRGYIPECVKKNVDPNTKNNNVPWCVGKEVGTRIMKSGVTVGTGVDLGQMNETDLKRLKLSDGLTKNLINYVGKQQDAQEYLAKHPLTLTQGQVNELNLAIKKSQTNRLIEIFNSNTTGKKFEELHPKEQTAVASFFYQNGVKEIDNDIWGAFFNNDWSAASALLREKKNFNDRRNKEADLITPPESTGWKPKYGDPSSKFPESGTSRKPINQPPRRSFGEIA